MSDRLGEYRAGQGTSPRQPLEAINLETRPTGQSTSLLSQISDIQDEIDQLHRNVRRISEHHTRMDSAVDSATRDDYTRLDAITEETRTLGNKIRDEIRAISRARAPQNQIERNRFALVSNNFFEAIKTYQKVESDHRARSKQLVERQLRIIKPDATADDVAAAMEGGSQQMFAEALTSTSRYAESRSAYREVQERQQELQKLERTFAELTQLFVEMGNLIDQQADAVNEVEATAKDVEANTRKGAEHTSVAVIHAESYRKKRKICFGIFLLIIIVLAIVLGVVFGTKK